MAEPDFWSQRDAAAEYTRLAAASESLFRALGALAPSLPGAGATAAAATLARRLGAHAASWDELVPESVLLEDARRSAPVTPELPADRAAVAAALRALQRALVTLLERTTEIADARARRLARQVLADLAEGPEDVLDPTDG
jgi:hypothetical protein